MHMRVAGPLTCVLFGFCFLCLKKQGKLLMHQNTYDLQTYWDLDDFYEIVFAILDWDIHPFLTIAKDDGSNNIIVLC